MLKSCTFDSSGVGGGWYVEEEDGKDRGVVGEVMLGFGTRREVF
jgi:hypothetical protein